MENKRIAIVGGGIVGLTTAYYMQQAGFEDITIFDDDSGQATKAAAGIISPWLSKRRNQRWYGLAKLGASLYSDIVATANLTEAAYRQNGTIVTRNDQAKLADLITLANERLATTPTMKSVYPLTATDINLLLPGVNVTDNGLFVAGGAQIDGATFLAELRHYIDIKIIKQRVQLDHQGQIINQARFDNIILATGAWLNEIVAPLGLTTSVRPQKGQLVVLNDVNHLNSAPVLMPEGEFDYIPLFGEGIIIGASHQDDKGFDLAIEDDVIQSLINSGININPKLAEANVRDVRVGTRAYTPDFAPFFGSIPEFSHIYVASGLGSSGLTTGPAIGYCLTQLMVNNQFDTTPYTKPISEYVYSL